MSEFIVIVESGADARTATKLAERILTDKIDWLEPDIIKYIFNWRGLQEETEYSCWKDVNKIIDDAKEKLRYRPSRYLGHDSKRRPLKLDGAASIKVLNLVHFLQRTREIKAVIFMRDLDHQTERRESIEQARSEDIIEQEQARLEPINRSPKLEIIIGAADPKREAWVLNGFIPSNQKEEQILEEIRNQLSFDPCIESHRLRSASEKEFDRIRNPKVIVEQLTSKNMKRERQCWEDTSLNLLRQRGVYTGLTAYIQEIEQYLTPII